MWYCQVEFVFSSSTRKKKCFEIILKYTFHKIFIKISQKLRPADGRTHARTGTGTESYHLLYDSTTTNTSPNTSGLTLGRRDFNFRTTGFALATPGLRPGILILNGRSLKVINYHVRFVVKPRTRV